MNIFLLWESERICICNSIEWEFFPNAAQRDNLECLESVPTCASLHVLIAPDIRHLPGWPQRRGRSAPGHLYLCHLTTASSGEKSHDILAFASFFQLWEKKQAQLSDCPLLVFLQAPSFYWEIEIVSYGDTDDDTGPIVSFGFATEAEKRDGAWTNPVGTCLFHK